MIESRAELVWEPGKLNPQHQLNTGPRGRMLLTRPGSKWPRNILLDSGKNDLNAAGPASSSSIASNV